MPMALARLADENLARTWQAMGRNGGIAAEHDSVVMVATGIPAAFFNGAYVTARTADPEAAIAAANRFMGDAGVPWLLWVRDGVDDELLAAGRQAGLRDAGGPPGMVMAQVPDPPPLPAGLEIETVADAAALADHWDVVARGYGMPREIATRLVTERTIADPAFAVLLGRVGGEPVSTAILSVTGRTAGVYTVGTPPEHRRRGYGAALTWAVVEEGRRRGCDHAALQASADGRPVYAAMGFADIGNYVQLEGPAGGAA